MSARTSNRKRAEECLSVNNSYSFLNSSGFRVSKRARFSSMNQRPERAVSAVPRIYLYPDPKPPISREVHAPCRTRKFDLLGRDWKLKSSGVFQKEETSDVMGNILSNNYLKKSYSAVASLQYSKKGKEVIDVDTEDGKNADSEDSSIEVVEVIEDGQEGRSVITDQRWHERDDSVVAGQELSDKVLQLQSNSSLVSDLTDGNMKVANARKMSGFLIIEQDISSVSAYKKMLEDVEKRTPLLKRLDFEIEVNEKHKSTLHLLRAKKKPLEEKPREPFVPLTEEEKDEIASAFAAHRKKVLITHESSGIEITGEILQCLRPGAWLNDEVINLYLELLKEREKREPQKFLKCHFFNTFFYKKLINGRTGYDFKSVRRWTSQRKLGYSLIECDKIFVPIHKEIHWCLAIINQKDKKFQYLDSLRGMDTKVLRVLAKYLVDEIKDKNGKDIDVSSWELEYVEDLPEQENGFDCGVFMIKYADFYSRGLDLCFNQGHMPYFRLRTAKEILRLRAE